MYIIFEGNDGCGKTTLITALNRLLHKSIMVSEPMDPKLKEIVEGLPMPLHDADMMTAFELDRATLWASSTRKYLERDYCILQSRSWVSTLVYNGPEDIGELSTKVIEWVDSHPEVDMWVYIETGLETILERHNKRGENAPNFDFESISERYAVVFEILSAIGESVVGLDARWSTVTQAAITATAFRELA